MLQSTQATIDPMSETCLAITNGAAGKAWQTPLGRYAPQRSESAAEGAAWAVVLQLPLEGLLSNGGGVQFVVKRGQGSQPEWLSGPDYKDFFIHLDQVTYKAMGTKHQLHLFLRQVSASQALPLALHHIHCQISDVLLRLQRPLQKFLHTNRFHRVTQAGMTAPVS